MAGFPIPFRNCFVGIKVLGRGRVAKADPHSVVATADFSSSILLNSNPSPTIMYKLAVIAFVIGCAFAQQQVFFSFFSELLENFEILCYHVFPLFYKL